MGVYAKYAEDPSASTGSMKIHYFTKGSVSKSGKVSFSSYIWVRIGSIGGGSVEIVNAVVCVVGHGGYGALIIDSKPVSRDGINRISFSSGGFSGTGRLVDVNVSAGGVTIFSGVYGTYSIVNVAIARARGSLVVSSYCVFWFSQFFILRF